MRERHNERIPVDHFFVIGGRNAVALCGHKMHLGTSNTLPQPDMAHRRKLELAHHDFQRAGDSIDAGRHAGHNGNFSWAGVDELCKGGSRCLILVYPKLPRRALLVPGRHEILQTGLHRIG